MTKRHASWLELFYGGDTVALTRDIFVFGHFVLLGAVLATSAGLGAAPRRLLVSAVPVVVVLGALALLGDDLSAPLALTSVFAALCTGHVGHRRP